MAGRTQGGYWYANAVRESELPPPARHVAHVLASVADNASGRVQVSLTWLTEATGMSRSAVAKHLNILERGGWIKRRRSRKAASMHERTQYVTVVPSGFPVGASPSHGLGLVRESDKASAPGGLSTTSTKAGAPSAGASGPAARTNRAALPVHHTPPNLGGVCGCAPRGKSADGECLACGGQVA